VSAPSLARRNARFLLALAPGAAWACLQWPGLGLRMAAAAVFALLLESVCLRLRALPAAPYLLEGGALRAALLLALWLPTLGMLPLLAALAVGLVLRQLQGGLGGGPFQPAMLAAAFAQLLFAATPMPADAGAPWLGLAWLGGGLALIAAGQLRWQGPLAFLTTAALCSFPLAAPLAVPSSAPWLLAACFLLPEAGGEGEGAAARALVGAVAGALAALAAPGAGLWALPFALLAGNALAPATSRALAPRRGRAA
jgi:Na+-translocating ferredoxin:NAD+ oxidoreductase RnfD subunit